MAVSTETDISNKQNLKTGGVESVTEFAERSGHIEKYSVVVPRPAPRRFFYATVLVLTSATLE